MVLLAIRGPEISAKGKSPAFSRRRVSALIRHFIHPRYRPQLQSPDKPNMADNDIIDQANEFILQECLLKAAQILQTVEDDSLLTQQHHQVLLIAQDLNESTADLRQDPDDSWTKQSETLNVTNQRDTTIHFKVTEPAHLQVRIDCVVETSLLVPFLSVLNETP